jgi:FkbM family methyltransferase
VEPNTIFNSLVAEYRNGDHLLNVAVAPVSGVADFIVFEEGGSSNTLSQEFADRKVLAQRTGIRSRRAVDCMTIKEVIDFHVGKFGQIPFILKLDIEGLDYDVMKTFPKTADIPFISIEDDEIDPFNPNSRIRALMSEKGYAPVATSVLSTLYVKKDSIYYKKIKLIGQFEIENS